MPKAEFSPSPRSPVAMKNVSAAAIHSIWDEVRRVPRAGAPAVTPVSYRHSRSRMYCGQFPNVWSTLQTMAPEVPRWSRPLTRLRRRVANSMPRIPMSAPGKKERSNASPETGFVSITSETGSGEVTNPS